jgi:hypothetical protein
MARATRIEGLDMIGSRFEKEKLGFKDLDPSTLPNG